MRKFSRKSIVIASSTALVLATSAVALAFWTGIGAGTGNAETGSAPSQALIVHQSGTPGGLVPGGPAADLSGTVENPNASGVFVNEVEGAVTGFGSDPQVDLGQPACSTADFEVVGTAVVNGVVPPSGGSLPWSGLGVRLLNTADNQDNCKNMTVVISYTTT